MPLALRDDWNASSVRRYAQRSKGDDHARRLFALAAIYDGKSRAEAAKIGGVTRQIVRDWVLRFNANGPGALVTRKAPGQPPRLTPAQREALMQAVHEGPVPARDGVLRWRLADLVRWIWDRFAVGISRQTLGRELRAMGYRKMSFRRDRDVQATDMRTASTNPSPPRWQRPAALKRAITTRYEVWQAEKS